MNCNRYVLVFMRKLKNLFILYKTSLNEILSVGKKKVACLVLGESVGGCVAICLIFFRFSKFGCLLVVRGCVLCSCALWLTNVNNMGHNLSINILFFFLPSFISLHAITVFNHTALSIDHQMTTTTPPASPSTTTSMSNSTSLQTSPDKRKQEDSYYSSVTSFGSNMSGNMIRVHTLDDDNSESESDSEVPSRTDNRTPTQKDFIDGSDLDLGLPFMRKDSDRPLRNGSPLNDRPMSLPPSSPTHGVETNNQRRLSLYGNIDVYYNAHYEQSMEESLEMIATPTGPAPVQIDMELPLFGPPISIPDGGTCAYGG